MAGPISVGLDDVAQGEVRTRFFFLEPTDFFTPFDSAREYVTAPLAEIAKALRENLNSAIAVASIPYVMAQASVRSRRFQAIHTAERIRHLRVSDGAPEDEHDREEQAYRVALARFEEEYRKPENTWAFAELIMRDLDTALKDHQFRSTAEELLRQSVVAIWGAFEVFLTDVIKCLVNDRPELSALLLSSETTRRHFPTKGVPIDALAKHGFNVVRMMGDVLFSDHQFDSLPVLREILSVLFPGKADLHRKLSEDGMWTFWQRRHVIVHKRGVIDQVYLSKTPDNLPLGSRVEVTSMYIDCCLILVRDAAVELLKAMRPPTPAV